MFLFFILFASIGPANNMYQETTPIKKSDTIYWYKDVRLQPSDFIGRPKQTVGDNTVPDVEYASEWSLYGNSLTVTAYSFMIRSNSWHINNKDSVKLDSTSTRLMYIHEDGHFSIVEIFARKLKQTLSNANIGSINPKKEINAIISKIRQDCELFQEKYDKETNYGMNYAAQEEWDKLLGLQLTELEKYKKRTMKFIFKNQK